MTDQTGNNGILDWDGASAMIELTDWRKRGPYLRALLPMKNFDLGFSLDAPVMVRLYNGDRSLFLGMCRLMAFDIDQQGVLRAEIVLWNDDRN